MLDKLVTPNHFFFFFLILFIGSCKKGQLDEKDIVKTDNYGNIIGNSSSDQWTPKPLSHSVDNDFIMRDFNEYIDMLYHGDTSLEPIYDCVLPSELDIIAFPNPVTNVEDLRIKLRSSKPICLYTFIYKGLVGNFPGEGSATGEFYQNNISDCRTEFDINPTQQFNFPTDDMEIIFIVVTDDGCVYKAEGNVLVE